jgi:hypothetical protein
LVVELVVAFHEVPLLGSFDEEECFNGNQEYAFQEAANHLGNDETFHSNFAAEDHGEHEHQERKQHADALKYDADFEYMVGIAFIQQNQSGSNDRGVQQLHLVEKDA